MPVAPRFQRSPGWVWRWCGGSVLVMGADRQAHQLDGPAALTWAALTSPATAVELVARDPERWSGAAGAAASLAQEALDELRAAGMVTDSVRPG